MCDCITQMDEALAPFNTTLVCTFNLFDKTLPVTMAMIATEKKDKTIRGKPKMLVPTYCPFCGKKYTGKGNGSMLAKPKVA